MGSELIKFFKDNIGVQSAKVENGNLVCQAYAVDEMNPQRAIHAGAIVTTDKSRFNCGSSEIRMNGFISFEDWPTLRDFIESKYKEWKKEHSKNE